MAEGVWFEHPGKLMLLSIAQVVAAACLVTQGIRWSRARQTAESLDWRACPICLYDLRDVPSEEDGFEGPWKCPECGERLELQEIVDHWRPNARALAELEAARKRRRSRSSVANEKDK